MSRCDKQMQATEPKTGVYHDGEEVAVRSSSQHSRSYHEPETNADGDVEFYDADGNRVPESHDDARPKPACGATQNGDTEWKLKATASFGDSRGKCSNCKDDDDTISERNKKGSGKPTLARRAQSNDFDATELLSANASHTD